MHDVSVGAADSGAIHQRREPRVTQLCRWHGLIVRLAMDHAADFHGHESAVLQFLQEAEIGQIVGVAVARQQIDVLLGRALGVLDDHKRRRRQSVASGWIPAESPST